ncbi:hypothetical protein BC831DRAFT_450832 [Entophlyctis helioformis]|nr:hypothetical protein BC831DRAFT_450832 [Entophlyctis helioformis]
MRSAIKPSADNGSELLLAKAGGIRAVADRTASPAMLGSPSASQPATCPPLSSTPGVLPAQTLH